MADQAVFDNHEMDMWLKTLLKTVSESNMKKVEKEWSADWAPKLATELKVRVPYSMGRRSPGSRRYGHLRDNITAKPGGVSFGRAFWWRFLDRGTAHQPPRPFVDPAIDQIIGPAGSDAASRIVVEMVASGAVNIFKKVL